MRRYSALTCRFDVLIRPDEFALAEILARQPVQQPAIQIESDAEREDAGVNLVVLREFATILASFCSPTVGRPSVMNSTKFGRLESFICVSAVFSAPSIFVLPPA